MFLLGAPGEVPLQLAGHPAGVGAPGGVLVQAAGHDLGQGRRDAELTGRHRHRGVRDHQLAELIPSGALVGQAPRQHLVEHQAEGPDVGGAGGRQGEPLLGGHVGRRALEALPLGLQRIQLARHPRQGACGRGGAGHGGSADHLGQAEVEDADAPLAADQDVGRLEVPVQQVVAVGLLQRVEHGQADARCLPGPQGPVLNATAQGLPLEILQGHTGLAVLVAHGVDGHDVRMVEAGRGAGLEEEALHDGARAGVLAVDDLERHLAPELGVPGQVHLTHAASPDEAHDPEVVHPVARLQRGAAVQHHHRILLLVLDHDGGVARLALGRVPGRGGAGLGQRAALHLPAGRR